MWPAGLVAAAALACGELGAPNGRAIQLSIAPVFSTDAAFAANADQLHVIIERVGPTDTVVVRDTVLAIDSTGTADGNVSVVLLNSPQEFLVLLAAVRSSDGAVLFSGQNSVTLTSLGSSGAPPPVSIPVAYTGPHGTSVVIAPRDTVIAPGGSFALRATVFGAAGIVSAPVTFEYVTPADSATLRVGRVSGVATAVAGATGTVKVFASAPDGLRDTTTVTVGSQSAPVATVTVTPAATIVIGATQQMTAVAKDAAGNVLTGRPVTWTSSLPGVASITTAGLVTGITAGTTTITATIGGVAGTANISVTPVPAGVKVTPGFGAVAATSTLTLTGAVVDAGGNAIPGLSVTWTSRTPATATVSAAGVVTGVAVGTTIVVATGSGFSDSTLIVVPTGGNVVASATAGSTRAFDVQHVGDTVVVSLTADMRFTPNEKLGSHGDTLSWNPAMMRFIDVQAGPVFAAPTVNSTGAAAGRIILAGADASSNAVGPVVFAIVRFKALAAGSPGATLKFNEMSGQIVGGTSTNFFGTNRITVINGTITIVP